MTATPCVNQSAFVADVTVPDNTFFRPGARIDKTWRVRNSGTCAWASGYRLVFASGERLGAPDSVALSATARAPAANVSVAMQAPGASGVFTGTWRLVDPVGKPFGDRLTIVIQVAPPNVPITSAGAAQLNTLRVMSADSTVYQVAFSPDGDMLATAGTVGSDSALARCGWGSVAQPARPPRRSERVELLTGRQPARFRLF